MSHNIPNLAFGDTNWDQHEIDWNDDIFEGTPRANSIDAFSNSANYQNQVNNGKIGDENDPEKKKVSDTITYGPRFCTLFDAYVKTNKLHIDTSRHLMSLCSDHLIQFLVWVRESDAQMGWVAQTLLNYDYLRPEVRNGIVMILIYTFASIKAVVDPGLDMFLTLQDADQGLGIANKFSLKIYNDPFGYLTFLKTAISALIDAGAIPDNERLNQPKRSKQVFENKEEVAAFNEIKIRIVALLDSGDNEGAKQLVQHINTYWQIRGKYVRNRRFVSALNSLKHIRSSGVSANHALLRMDADKLAELDAADAIAFEQNDFFSNVAQSVSDPAFSTGSAAASLPVSTSSSSSSGKKAAAPSPALVGNVSRQNSITGAIGDMHLSGSTGSLDNSTVLTNGNTAPTRQPPDTGTVTRGAATLTGSNSRKRQSADMAGDSAPLPPPPQQQQAPPITRASGGKAPKNGISSMPQQLQLQQLQQPPIQPMVFGQSQPQQQQQSQIQQQFYRPPPQQQMPFVGGDMSGHAMQQPQQAPPLVSQQQLHVPQQLYQGAPTCDLTCLNVPVCALRLERVGLTEWEVKETQVYDVEAFLQSVHSSRTETPVCLVDENCLQAEVQSMRLEARSLGMISLVGELQQRRALCTSWPRKELSQFRNFIRSWQDSNSTLQNVNGGRSLHEFWKWRTPSQQHNNKQQSQGGAGHVQGLIVYEISVSVGLLVRACPAVGLFEDIWCFVYPNEVAASHSGETFGAFLENQFPQLKTINNRLAYFSSGSGKILSGPGSSGKSAGQQGGGDVTVKYYAHKTDRVSSSSTASASSAARGDEADHKAETPDAVPSSSYQTIGTFSMPAVRVISRLFNGPLFHDFVLELQQGDRSPGGGGGGLNDGSPR